MSIAKIDLKVKIHFFKIFLNLPETCEIEYMPNLKFRPTTKANLREILFT